MCKNEDVEILDEEFEKEIGKKVEDKDEDDDDSEDDDNDDDIEDDKGHGEERRNKEEEDDDKIDIKNDSIKLVEYKDIPIEKMIFLETFQKDFDNNGWIKSTNALYQGKWQITRRKEEAIINDYGLKMIDEKKHFGISTFIPEIINNKDNNFILQYEVKFENDLICGGAYIKVMYLSNSDNTNRIDILKSFNAFSDYVIMFGPDKCGQTNRVHFILKYKNPHTGKWTEHQFNNQPLVPEDLDTHIYTLWIKPDDTFEILIDYKDITKGNLRTDMKPPIILPKNIDDPEDTEPADWPKELIEDPEATPPEGWKKDTPEYIPDPVAKMPEGWLEDEPRVIPDTTAKKPQVWDDKVLGEWKPPMIENPKCKNASGCGKWNPPQIKNPQYISWDRPFITNPNYKGRWTPRKIENPEYFEDNALHALNKINALGFELWSVEGGVIFDNILVTNDFQAAKNFADQTWKVRYEIEQRLLKKKKKNKMTKDTEKNILEKSSSSFDYYIDLIKAYYEENPTAFMFTSIAGLALLLFIVGKSMSKKKKEDKNIKDNKNENLNKNEEENEEEDEDEAEEEKNKEDDKNIRQRKTEN